MRRFAFVLAIMAVLALGFGAGLAAQAAQAAKAPGVVVLKGAPNGDVKFDHPAHVKAAANKCETCHHASKPEKPGKGNEACTDCHTKVAAAPMKTKLQGAFHNPMAKQGTCVDCHAKEVAAGKKVPAKCTDCHKKGA
jgi:hypothetical protein